MPSQENKTTRAPQVITVERTALPPRYKVLVHNDDFTTKIFVIELLVAVFHKPLDAAATLMWQIHHHGAAVAGVYPFEIAETKAEHAMALARANEFPLRLTLEME